MDDESRSGRPSAVVVAVSKSNSNVTRECADDSRDSAYIYILKIIMHNVAGDILIQEHSNS